MAYQALNAFLWWGGRAALEPRVDRGCLVGLGCSSWLISSNMISSSVIWDPDSNTCWSSVWAHGRICLDSKLFLFLYKKNICVESKSQIVGLSFWWRTADSIRIHRSPFLIHSRRANTLNSFCCFFYLFNLSRSQMTHLHLNFSIFLSQILLTSHYIYIKKTPTHQLCNEFPYPLPSQYSKHPFCQITGQCLHYYNYVNIP